MPDSPEKTYTMAVFCDFENLALGTRDAKYDKFDITKVLERLLIKGHIVVKKAYCDWERYSIFKKAMHEASFELIEIPHTRQAGKNSADIRMVVDALDLCYTKPHMDTFVIMSGDSDFSPLVSKLRENNKTVIGVSVKNSTSDLFISNCDEFIFYDDLVREQRVRRPAPPRAPANPPTRKPANGSSSTSAVPSKEAVADAKNGAGAPTEVREKEESKKRAGDPEAAIQLVADTADALIEERGGDDRVWGAFVKQTIKRRQPGFSERFHGFRSFNALLEAARDRGLLNLTLDEKSGGYIITSTGENVPVMDNSSDAPSQE